MKQSLLAASFAIGLAVSPNAAKAADTVSQPSVSNFSWHEAQDLLKTVLTEIQSGGIFAVKAHSDQMEQALAAAPAQLVTTAPDGSETVLADGLAEALIASATLAKAKPTAPVKISTFDNPYPLIALYLGSYYNEIEKPDDALRVLNAGLAASVVTGIDVGAHRPLLLTERGAAFAALKRWQDSLDSEDEALKEGADLAPSMIAHIQRGRGFALTELGRLDDAEAAYRESLKLQPGDQRAASELQYIARLRAGAPPTKPYLAPVQPQSDTPPPDATQPH